MYVYGSQLNGYAREDSDIDIGVLFDEAVKKEDFFKKRIELIKQLSSYCKRQADVAVLNQVPLLLRYTITSEGQYLYESSESEHIFYQLKVMNEYLDFKPFLDAYYKKHVETHYA
jgi:uncharacterized protein